MTDTADELNELDEADGADISDELPFSLKNVLKHSSLKIRQILEFMLTYATISCWWQEAEMRLIPLLRPKAQITINFEAAL